MLNNVELSVLTQSSSKDKAGLLLLTIRIPIFAQSF